MATDDELKIKIESLLKQGLKPKKIYRFLQEEEGLALVQINRVMEKLDKEPPPTVILPKNLEGQLNQKPSRLKNIFYHILTGAMGFVVIGGLYYGLKPTIEPYVQRLFSPSSVQSTSEESQGLEEKLRKTETDGGSINTRPIKSLSIPSQPKVETPTQSTSYQSVQAPSAAQPSRLEKGKTDATRGKESIEQAKIFQYHAGKVTITPVAGFGVASYAALLESIAPEQLSALSAQEQRARLRAGAKALSKKQGEGLETILARTREIIQENKQNIYREATTPNGLKDPKRNILYVGKPLTYAIKEETPKEQVVLKEQKTFTYDPREVNNLFDDQVMIRMTVPGAGIAQYATVLVRQGLHREALNNLSQQSAEEQIQQVQAVNIKTLPKKNRADVLRLTRDIIINERNKGEIVYRDQTGWGMKDGKKNVVGVSDTLYWNAQADDASLFVPRPVQNELETIIEGNNGASLPDLRTVVEQYFTLWNIQKSSPSLDGEQIAETVLENIARQYNNSVLERGVDEVLDPTLTREERIRLARDLYQKTSDQKRRDTYMTIDEILDLVNEAGEQKITERNIRSSLSEGRSSMLHRRMQERRYALQEQHDVPLYGKAKTSFVKERAQQYGVSTSTIYKDLRMCARELVEPRNLHAA